ncbi:MAG: hypothetical protein M3520_02535, partial [Actinomycetota bacterium]|nr:hypothetical protein [Actinomycetota bacterium]
MPSERRPPVCPDLAADVIVGDGVLPQDGPGDDSPELLRSPRRHPAAPHPTSRHRTRVSHTRPGPLHPAANLWT